jgi:NADH:ubiquinone oxidoreductase subunit 6 (subunit J)
MSEVVFFIAGIGAIAGALGVVMLGNPFYAVLSLIGHLISLAALFLLLQAEFLAAAQVVVYAGAVMVLYIFVVSYIGGRDEPLYSTASNLRGLAVLFAGLLAVELMIAVLGSGIQAIDSRGAPYDAAFGTPGEIGEMLLTRFLLAFELASFLLLVAAVGAVILARRRRGLPQVEPSPTTAHAPGLEYATPGGPRVGTMAETAGVLPHGEDEVPGPAGAPWQPGAGEGEQPPPAGERGW